MYLYVKIRKSFLQDYCSHFCNAYTPIRYTYILFFLEFSRLLELQARCWCKRKKGTWSFSGQRLCLPRLFRHLRIFITSYPISQAALGVPKFPRPLVSYPSSFPLYQPSIGVFGVTRHPPVARERGEQLILRVICTPRVIS